MSRALACCGALLVMTTSGCFFMGSSKGSSMPGSEGHPVEVKQAPDLKAPGLEQAAWADVPHFLGGIIRVAPGDPPPIPMRAYVVGADADSDWIIDRTPRGVPKERTLQALVFFKGGKSGKCQETIALLVELNKGGDQWGTPFLRTTNTNYLVTCASVDALRPSPPPAS